MQREIANEGINRLDHLIQVITFEIAHIFEDYDERVMFVDVAPAATAVKHSCFFTSPWPLSGEGWGGAAPPSCIS